MHVSSCLSRVLNPAVLPHTRTRATTVAVCRHHNRRRSRRDHELINASVIRHRMKQPRNNINRPRGAAIITAATDSEPGDDGEGDEEQKNETTETTTNDETALSGLARRLVERRYDPKSAQSVLDTFDRLGIQDEEDLKKFFAEVSLPQLGGQVGQIVTVGLSAWAALYVRAAVANDPDISGPTGGLLYFGLGVTGLTLSLECVTNTLLLAGAVATTVVWGLNPKAFLSAVRASAGDLAATGLGAVDRAAELAKAVGVAQSLLDLQEALGAKLKTAAAGGGDGGGARPSATTVDKLGAMLTLSKAKDDYGFDAARVGLTAEEAADLASTFSRFDVAGTGKLNSGDLYDLARELGIALSVEDSQAVRS